MDFPFFYLDNLDLPAQVCVLIVLLSLPFAATYLTTSLLFRVTRWKKVKGARAPLVPYSVPVIGHAMAFALSIADLIQDNL